MKTSYFDRYGTAHTPQTSSKTITRDGVWFILLQNNAILFTHPNYAPNVPELPGGGIDEGETIIQAACRELYEEAELKIPLVTIEAEHKQFVNFYAEHDLEYWDYNQTFILVTKDIESLYFTGKQAVSEGHREWIDLGNLNQHQIHHMHKKALKHFKLLNN